MESNLEFDLSCPVTCEIFSSPMTLLTGDGEETVFYLEEDTVLDLIEHAKNKPIGKDGVLFIYAHVEITGYRSNRTLARLAESYCKDNSEAQHYQPKVREVASEEKGAQQAPSAEMLARQENLFFEHVAGGNCKAVKALIEDTDVNPRTAMQDGHNALFYAALPEMVSLLQRYGLVNSAHGQNDNIDPSAHIVPESSTPPLQRSPSMKDAPVPIALPFERSSSMELLQGSGRHGLFQPAPEIDPSRYLPVAVLCSRYGYDMAEQDARLSGWRDDGDCSTGGGDKGVIFGSSVGLYEREIFRVAAKAFRMPIKDRDMYRLGGHKSLRIETFRNRFFLYDNSDKEDPMFHERCTFVLIFSGGNNNQLADNLQHAHSLLLLNRYIDMKEQLFRVDYTNDSVELTPCQSEELLNQDASRAFQQLRHANVELCGKHLVRFFDVMRDLIKYELKPTAVDSRCEREISLTSSQTEKTEKSGGCGIQ